MVLKSGPAADAPDNTKTDRPAVETKADAKASPEAQAPRAEKRRATDGDLRTYAASQNAEVQNLLAERQTAVMNKDDEHIGIVDEQLADAYKRSNETPYDATAEEPDK